MSERLELTVYGVAQPKGSTKAFAHRIKTASGKEFIKTSTTSANPKVAGWQQLVAEAASRQLTGGGRLFSGPIRILAAFYLPRPKKLKKGVSAHLTKPDLDKLIRAVKDALTGVVWSDDSQVTQLKATKDYIAPGESPRAVVVVEPLERQEDRQ